MLRSQLPIWLKQPPLDRLVIAIDHAVQRDGGAGAYYIRLKRKEGSYDPVWADDAPIPGRT